MASLRTSLINIFPTRKYIFFILVLCLEFNTLILTHETDILIRKEPGLYSPQKVWWAKEVTPNLHVAGHLSRRQILYAAEAGFKSIVSLFWVKPEDASVIYGEFRPSSPEAANVTKEAGIGYATVFGPNEDDDWATIGAIDRLSDVLRNVQKPVLLHCCRGFTIAVLSLLYLAKETRHNPTFTPKVNSEIFYEKIASLGYDITCLDFIKDLVSEVTEEPIPNRPHCPQVDIEEWMDYWEAHPVHKNWFIAGQIRSSDISTIHETGFKSIVNFRLGGEGTQEAVTLLNVLDATPTYDANGTPFRQSDHNLQNIRINISRGNNYVSEGCGVNFQRTNKHEFGDDIGYNETLEKMEFQKNNLTYFHMPIALDEQYDPELFGKYKDKLLELGKEGPVLLHCDTGKRAAYIGVLAASVQYKKNMEWALKKLQELGFSFTQNSNPDIYNMYRAWLGNSDKDVFDTIVNKDEL